MRRKPRHGVGSAVKSPAAARAKARPVETGNDNVDSVNSVERIIARPDGHHWLSLDGRREFGPFDSFEAALADMQADAEETAVEPGETLQEAERELGISDWIDPDSGEPAEGLSTPRLRDE